MNNWALVGFLTVDSSKAVVLTLFIPCIILWPLAVELYLFHPVWCLVLVFVPSYLPLWSPHLGKRELATLIVILLYVLSIDFLFVALPLNITKTCLFKYSEHFNHQKKWKFSDKNSDISHTSGQNIDCGYSLEMPRRGGSNEYPQSMFLGRNKKNNVYPCKPQFHYIKVGFKGVHII